MEQPPTASALALPGDGPLPNHAVLLRAGVARGIITDDQALALDRLAREDVAAQDEPRDDERLRFVTGFADIFVTLGLVLFFGTTGYLGIDRLGPVGGYGLVAIEAWVLAEFFTRRRRMALPSIVLLVVFALATYNAAGFTLVDPDTEASRGTTLFDLVFRGHPEARPLIGTGLVTLLLVGLHYWRFKVPITIAAGTAALIGLLLGLVAAVDPFFAYDRLPWLLSAAGLGTFALAMRFDLSDPRRLTRRTDIAFWLHLLAAPMIVHPVLSAVANGNTSQIGLAFPILAIVLGLASVALVTDRRAILVSSLVYAGLSFDALLREIGITGNVLPLALLALGTFILLLSAGWHPLRARILRALPRPWAARLPHPIGA
ncbi:hypothetical protein [Methylobacterium sp. Leaf102]|uniref:hypothetical protein n=1 Tax=Methylobacterium sp. Leaf102 TaxID=1736253 RepID=UPI000A71B86D|nr:hypothetical protein [Methylobacterium sp. Leaf102]